MSRYLVQFGVYLIVSIALFSARASGQIGSIDAPQFEDVVSGQWIFGGWSMDSSYPVSNVEIFVDGTDYGPSPYGNNRQDACNVIGNYPGCPNVGWTVLFNTGLLPDGPHLLTVVSTTSDGRQSTMLQPFIVDNAQQGLTGTTYYQIISRATGGVLDVTNAGLTAGSNIQEWYYYGGPNQLWKVVPTDDGNWTFESLNSSKVLTVPFGASTNGTIVQQFEDYGSPYQEWSMVAAGGGSYALYNVATGKSLDLTGGNPAIGTPIQIWDYWAGSNQNWLLIPVTALPSGLFGSGGSSGEDSPPPPIDPSDILFADETSGFATSFASGANGPACEAPGELANLNISRVQPDGYGVNHIAYAYTNAEGNRKVRPAAGVKTAFDFAFQDWDTYTSTTYVDFEALAPGAPVSAALVDVAKTNNEASAYCLQINSVRGGSLINYGDNFEQTAQANINAPRPTIPEGEAAHEIGHFLGLAEAGTNPSTPTVMNQGYNPGGLAAVCSNPMGAPQKRPTPQDATTANSCIAQGRRALAQGSYGGVSVAYSTISYYPYGCTFVFNTVTWLLDDGFSSFAYPMATGDCPY